MFFNSNIDPAINKAKILHPSEDHIHRKLYAWIETPPIITVNTSLALYFHCHEIKKKLCVM